MDQVVKTSEKLGISDWNFEIFEIHTNLYALPHAKTIIELIQLA